MVGMKIFVFFFIFMISPSTILAQESTASSSLEPGNSQNAPTLPFGSGIFDHFPIRPPSFDLSALWPHFATAELTPRHKRTIEDSSEIEDHLRAKRRVITCNFLTQGGFRCTSCNTVRRCYPFNLGTVTTCGAVFRYCNNGVCSKIKGSLCSSTTSTPISTSISTSAATSTSESTSISISTSAATSTSESTSASTFAATSTSISTSTSTSESTSISTSTSTSTPISTSASTTSPASTTDAANSTGSG